MFIWNPPKKSLDSLAGKLNLNCPYSPPLPQRPKFKFNFPAKDSKDFLAGFIKTYAFTTRDYAVNKMQNLAYVVYGWPFINIFQVTKNAISGHLLFGQLLWSYAYYWRKNCQNICIYLYSMIPIWHLKDWTPYFPQLHNFPILGKQCTVTFRKFSCVKNVSISVKERTNTYSLFTKTVLQRCLIFSLWGKKWPCWKTLLVKWILLNIQWEIKLHLIINQCFGMIRYQERNIKCHFSLV